VDSSSTDASAKQVETGRESAREREKENTLNSDQVLDVMTIDHDAFLNERRWLKYMLVLAGRPRWRERSPERVDACVDAARDV
jgi:hypothetical protein